METIYEQTEKKNFGGDRLRRIPIGVAGYPRTQKKQKKMYYTTSNLLKVKNTHKTNKHNNLPFRNFLRLVVFDEVLALMSPYNYYIFSKFHFSLSHNPTRKH